MIQMNKETRLLRNKLLKIRNLSEIAIDEINEIESNSFNKEPKSFGTYDDVLNNQIPCYESMLKDTYNLMFELNELDLIVSLNEDKFSAEMESFYKSEELNNLKN